MQAYPNLALSVRANRAFLARAVRFLVAEAGIRQFLDIGTGIPTADNPHEVAQGIGPASRIVYVDHDPIVLAHAKALLTSTLEGATAYLDADLRDPDAILAAAADTLDFHQPVAVMLIAVMHFIGDDAEAGTIMNRLAGACAPGSFVALSHAASDIDAEQMAETVRRAGRADVGPAQRPGAARGRGPHRFFRGHPHLADRERDAERHAGRERGARVAVGGQGHRGARVEQPPRVGERLPGAELRAGQQGRDHLRGDQRVEVGVGQERAVVPRRGARLGRPPDLPATVVVPGRSISAASRPRFARSTAWEAARVASTVTRMPPAR